MVWMWLVDGVIVENGGFFIWCSLDGYGVECCYWYVDDVFDGVCDVFWCIVQYVVMVVLVVCCVDDQDFWLMLFVYVCIGGDQDDWIFDVLIEVGVDVIINNLWVIGWVGGYDKLLMLLCVLVDMFGVDVGVVFGCVVYLGDFMNDVLMFGYFMYMVGMSIVIEYLLQLFVLL